MRSTYAGSAFIFFLLFGLTVQADAPGKATKTSIPGDRYTLPTGGDKVVYGTDDRIDVYQETDPRRLTWAASTVGLIKSTAMIENNDGSFTLLTGDYEQFGLPACFDEPFADQPVVASCSGFMVGPDLIATAGHCYNESSFNSIRFVFGFDMLDATTPVLLVSGEQVYRGVEIVGRLLEDGFDYCVVRVDRDITAPDAHSFRIRREGVIGVGEEVGVIGHPSGLPKKIAFSSDTRVRSNDEAAFFVANLDTYGGNSGSPVINPITGILEGILVRGERDYISNDTCFNSNVVGNDVGRGEDVSKTTTFMQFIPELAVSAGELTLNKAAFSCTDTIEIELADNDLEYEASVLVNVTTDAGDSESLTLTESIPGIFGGSIAVETADVIAGNGRVDIAEGDTVTVLYADADNGTGSPADVTLDAPIDCTLPIISNVQISSIGATQAVVTLETNEECVPRVHYGGTCGFLLLAGSGLPGTQHTIVLNNLSKNTVYPFRVSAEDSAGNLTIDNNGGSCYSFTTLDAIDYLTQQFVSGIGVLQNTTFTFVPDDSDEGYAVCSMPAAGFLTTPAGGSTLTVGDDDFELINLGGGAQVQFFGQSYSRIYVGSNGFISFGAGDDEFSESYTSHFTLPRISALFEDFNPNAGVGKILMTQLDDRVVITWQEVFEYYATIAPAGANSFQVELFFDGKIRITYLNLYTQDGLVGLSRGLGVPADFTISDFTRFGSCSGIDSDDDGLSDADEVLVYGTDPDDPDSDDDDLPDGWEVSAGLDPNDNTGDNGAAGNSDDDGLDNAEEYANGTHPQVADSDYDGVSDGDEVANETDPTGAGVPHAADYTGDFEIDLSEVLRVIQFYNLDEYHCDESSEDGFAPGTGDRSCFYHNADYIAADWSLDLSEILRTIQLFSADHYVRDTLGEDGFRPIFD